jgi:hypothetical protein
MRATRRLFFNHFSRYSCRCGAVARPRLGPNKIPLAKCPVCGREWTIEFRMLTPARIPVLPRPSA